VHEYNFSCYVAMLHGNNGCVNDKIILRVWVMSHILEMISECEEKPLRITHDQLEGFAKKWKLHPDNVIWAYEDVARNLGSPVVLDPKTLCPGRVFREPSIDKMSLALHNFVTETNCVDYWIPEG